MYIISELQLLSRRDRLSEELDATLVIPVTSIRPIPGGKIVKCLWKQLFVIPVLLLQFSIHGQCIKMLFF